MEVTALTIMRMETHSAATTMDKDVIWNDQRLPALKREVLIWDGRKLSEKGRAIKKNSFEGKSRQYGRLETSYSTL